MGQAWWFTDVYGLGPNVGVMRIIDSEHIASNFLVTKHVYIMQNRNPTKAIQLNYATKRPKKNNNKKNFFLPPYLRFVIVL